MIRKSLLTLSLLLSAAAAFGQGYYMINKTGIDDQYILTPAQGTYTTLIAADKNDVLADGTIPFDFSFYGEKFTSYKVSDNGYITFDQSETTSQPDNVALPDASAPKKAIFAFWDDLDTKAFSPYSTEVRSWNYGTAPNRVHVIQWFTVSPHSQPVNTNYMYFAIRLYENGTFDVVYNYMANTSYSMSATVGIQNGDGTQAVTTGSTLDFPIKNGNNVVANYKVIWFRPGTQPDDDIQLTTMTTPRNVKEGDKLTPHVELYNYGKKTLTAFTVNYQVDNNTPMLAIVKNVSISPGNKYAFDVPKSYTVPNTAGKLAISKVWVSEPNGNDPAPNPGDDTLWSSTFIIKGNDAGRRPLFEGTTGAWCIHCPDGHVFAKDMKAQYPGVIVVEHHYVDAMQNTESLAFCQAYSIGYPSATFDRYMFSDQGTVAVNRGLWNDKAAARMDAAAPVKVTITNKTYDPATRKINFTVRAEFVDYARGDIRLNAYLVEDYVRGPKTGATGNTSQWDQQLSDVYYNNPSHPLYQYPAIMPYYPHDNVMFKAFDGVWGKEGLADTLVAPGTIITRDYSYTLPAATNLTVPENSLFGPKGNVKGRYKDNDIFIVGYAVEYPKSGLLAQAEVLNAEEVKLTNDPTTDISDKPMDVEGIGSLQLYPNPATSNTNLTIDLKSSARVQADLVDIMGRTVKAVISNQQMAAGQHSVQIDVSTLPKGIYLLNLNANGKMFTQKITVE